MAFRDYSTTPSANTQLGDGTFIGPNMLRNKVRPALQQLAADGKALANDVAAETAARTAAIASIPQGIPGVNGGVGSSAGFAALFAAASGMEVGAGVTRIKTDGHTNPGVGSAEYIHDPAINALNVGVGGNVGTAFLAADGRGFKLDPTQRITFDMFGAIPGDYATGISPDCVPAWNRLQNWIKTIRRNVSAAFQAAGTIVYFPSPQYYFSTTITNSVQAQFIGMGAGIVNFEATWLRFPINVGGIINRDDEFTATGSVFDGFTVQGGIGTPTATGVFIDDIMKSGFRMLARCTIRNCTFRNFVGVGILISASVAEAPGGQFLGNANNWKVVDCRLEYNLSGGIYVSGGDANAGKGEHIDATFNGRFGFVDNSLAGNLWTDCHTDQNGANAYPASLGTTVVTYGGNHYYMAARAGEYDGSAHDASTIDAANQAAARAVTPGTNENVWRYIGPGTVYPEWNNTRNYIAGGSYASNSPFTVFEGCYFEINQIPPQVNALTIGGFMGADVDAGGTVLAASARGLSVRRGFLVPRGYADGSVSDVNLGGEYTPPGSFDTGGQSLLSWNSSQATPSNPEKRFNLIAEKATGDLVFTEGGFRLTTGATGARFGTDAAGAADAAQIYKLALGLGNNARVMQMGSAAPTSGLHARGEVVWNNGDVTDIATVSYWQCSATGTPGTWIAKA